MITNYCERFSKKELNECGKQLAFLDNNILGDIRQILEKNLDFKNSIKNTFLSKNLLPVLNNFAFYEFIKGLEKQLDHSQDQISLTNNRVLALLQTKRSTIGLLEDLGSLWILNAEHVLGFELVHLYYNRKENAYDYYKLFSKTPLDRAGSCLGKSYLCDKYFPYGFIPYAKSDEKETIPNLTLSEYFDGLCDDLFKGESQDIDNKIMVQFVHINDAVSTKKQLLAAKKIEEIWKGRMKMILMPILGPEGINVRTLDNTYQNLNNDFINSPNKFLQHAPLLSVFDAFYWKNMNEWHLVNPKKKKSHIYDRLHAEVALSYCDCFITNDEELQKRSIEIIDPLNLSVKVGRFNTEKIEIEWLN